MYPPGLETSKRHWLQAGFAPPSSFSGQKQDSPLVKGSSQGVLEANNEFRGKLPLYCTNRRSETEREIRWFGHIQGKY